MTATKNPTTDVVSIAESAVTGLQNAIAQLVERRTLLTSKKNTLLSRVSELYDTPLSTSEVKEVVCQIIDRRALEYTKRLENFNFLGKLKNPKSRPSEKTVPFGKLGPGINFEDAERFAGRPRIHGRSGLGHLDEWKLDIFLGYGDFDLWPYFFLGELMKEKLCQFIDSVDNTGQNIEQEGLPKSLDERRKTMDAILQEVTGLDQELASVERDIRTLSQPIISGSKALSAFKMGAS